MPFENLRYTVNYEVSSSCLEIYAFALTGKSGITTSSVIIRKELRVTLIPDGYLKSIMFNAAFNSSIGLYNLRNQGGPALIPWLRFYGKRKEDFIGKSLVIELCNDVDKTVEFKAEITLSSNENMNGETRCLQLTDLSIYNQKILCTELDSLKTSLDKIGDVSTFVNTERQKIQDRQKQEKKELDDKYEVDKKELEDKHKEELKMFDYQTKEIFRKKRSLTESGLQLPECPVCWEEMRSPVQIFNCIKGHVICGECRSRVSICTHCREPYIGRATAMELWIKGIV